MLADSDTFGISPSTSMTATPNVDMAAGVDAVRAAVDGLPTPEGVFDVRVVEAVSDTFGCRIAVDLSGTFDEQTEEPAIACRYAERLSLTLGVPVFALYDLLRRDYPAR